MSAAIGVDGGSNSRPANEIRPRWDRVGLDTVSVLWGQQGGSELLSAIVAAPSVPFARGRLVLDRSPAGARVMAWPEFGVVKLECRLGALIDGTAESHRLGTRDELRQVGDVAAGELATLVGARPDTRAVQVGRLDLVTERDFADGRDGMQLLRAMRSLCPPRCKLDVIADQGRVETVSVLRGRRKIFRAYDKGVEARTHAPGERVRFEAQVRRAKSARQGPNATATGDLRAAFGRTIEPFMEGAPVTVTSPSGVSDQLVSKVVAGELSIARAERLAGAADFLRRYGRAIYGEDWRSARRLKELREVGIAVDDELPEGATVPVSHLLSSALEAWTADV